jgi:hypothetical protein
MNFPNIYGQIKKYERRKIRTRQINPRTRIKRD